MRTSSKTPWIAVAVERHYHWHEGFAAALATVRNADPWFDFEVVDLDTHDWMERVEDFDCVLWKSYVLGPEAAAHFKEKVYFLETQLGKLVFPNFKTIWHFESKVAQSYVFAKAGIPTPKTVVTFDYHDAVACLDSAEPPYVFKRSAGAGSNNVWLVESRAAARAVLEETFAHQLWTENVPGRQRTKRLMAALPHMSARWMRARIKERLLGREQFRPAYWQEFVRDNDADLRITIIGRRYACAFWRHNRPNDFRASGSGLIDYAREIPMAALELCFDFVQRMDFDTMAFDLLVRDGKYLVAEMSYAYVAKAIADAPGLFERTDGVITYVPGSKTPQELWALGLLERVRQRSADVR